MLIIPNFVLLFITTGALWAPGIHARETGPHQWGDGVAGWQLVCQMLCQAGAENHRPQGEMWVCFGIMRCCCVRCGLACRNMRSIIFRMRQNLFSRCFSLQIQSDIQWRKMIHDCLQCRHSGTQPSRCLRTIPTTTLPFTMFISFLNSKSSKCKPLKWWVPCYLVLVWSTDWRGVVWSHLLCRTPIYQTPKPPDPQSICALTLSSAPVASGPMRVCFLGSLKLFSAWFIYSLFEIRVTETYGNCMWIYKLYYIYIYIHLIDIL